MDTQTFITIIRSCRFLPHALKGKLLLLAPYIDEHMRLDIVRTLEQCLQNQHVVSQEVLGELCAVERSLKRNARTLYEQREHDSAMQHFQSLNDE